MYLKIKNKSFWNIACKQTDNIYSLLNIMIKMLEQLTIQNFSKVSKFTDANCIIKNNRIEIEVGYMRYDEDDKSAEKHNEKHHPKYHLDIFFDNNISCKIGIKKFNINIEKIFDRLFDKEEEKFFLTN